MNIYLFILTLFCLGTLKGQNLQDLRNEKTIFIVYNVDDNNIKKQSSSITNGKIKTDTYFYTFTNHNKKDDCEPDQFNFWIKYISYESFNDLSKNKKTPKFKISKKFLEINKTKIIDRAFMDSIGYKKTFNLLNSKDSIYIVDMQECDNETCIVKKASFSFSPEE